MQISKLVPYPTTLRTQGESTRPRNQEQRTQRIPQAPSVNRVKERADQNTLDAQPPSPRQSSCSREKHVERVEGQKQNKGTVGRDSQLRSVSKSKPGVTREVKPIRYRRQQQVSARDDGPLPGVSRRSYETSAQRTTGAISGCESDKQDQPGESRASAKAESQDITGQEPGEVAKQRYYRRGNGSPQLANPSLSVAPLQLRRSPGTAAEPDELSRYTSRERSTRRNAIYDSRLDQPVTQKEKEPRAAKKVLQTINKTPCSMAGVKKYAGLPDLDLGTEIYESTVPDLTEASTLPTDSTDESDSDNPNFDKHGLNRDAARARFEPAVIDARNANFSDIIDGGRRDYRARSRRRRRRADLVDGQSAEDYEDDDEPETTYQRLLRLQRETAELQAEIERIENRDKDGDDESDYEKAQEGQDDILKGARRLGKALEGIAHSTKRRKGPSLEQQFMRGLQEEPDETRAKTQPVQQEDLPESSISAIADFSDRLTALETALGVSSLSPSTTATPSVLPTLDTLTTQIETLSSTLSPRPEPSSTTDPRSLTNPTTSTVHLDPLASKIRHLISESKRLEDSRRAATRSFEELLETRDRHAHLLHSHAHSAVHAGTEARLTRNLSSQDVNGRPASGAGQNEASTGMTRKEDMQQQFTSLFLDDQASRITALYNLLPTLQSLQPLLPVVLERLRALSVIHAGAAEVKGELDDFENRLSSQEKDIKKWREAVESAEEAMREGREVLKENVGTVGEAVRGLERRIRELQGGR